MRLLLCVLLVFGVLPATGSFGFVNSPNFDFTIFLESNGGEFSSGLLAGKGNFKNAELVLKFGAPSSPQAGMAIYQYSLHYDNKDGEVEVLTVATWLTAADSTEVFAIDSEGNRAGVIGKHAPLPNENNSRSVTIETADTKLKIEGLFHDKEQTYLTVSAAEKTLADGQVIKWQDKLTEREPSLRITYSSAQ